METVAVLPTAIDAGDALIVMDCSAFLIVKVTVFVPPNFPLPVMVTVAVIAVLAVAGVLMADRSKASAAVGNYKALIVHADSLMQMEDSVNVAMKYVIEAEALAKEYSDTKYSGRFGNLAEGCHKKLDHVIDSLFTRNRDYMDFYMARYRDNGDVEDKKKALEYLDKALELKNDEDLSTMRRILK